MTKTHTIKTHFDGFDMEFVGDSWNDILALRDRTFFKYQDAKNTADAHFNTLTEPSINPYPKDSLEWHGYNVRYAELLTLAVTGDKETF
jgi:hypothetical protein